MEYGLIGEKLGHSFSKPIHEKLADYNYEITPITKEYFHDFMKNREFKAINVTIPYKADVIPYLDVIDENARKIGAVNTIVNKENKLYGYNTDFLGFLYTLKNHNIEIENKKVVVLGNGGAAKAVIACLTYLKAKEIIIVKRTSGEGFISYEECREKHKDAQIVINTSPVGMFPVIDASPMDLTHYTDCRTVVDVIYNPLKTKLLKQGEELGMLSINGLEMLIAQAKYAVEIFKDIKIPDSVIEEIRQEFMKEL